MPRREAPQKGQFIVAGGGTATVTDKRDKIRKGQFMTVDAVVDRPASLSQRYPEMADTIAAAGPIPTAADLAKHWAEQAEIEARLIALRNKVAEYRGTKARK